jgi:hypothetical protein
VTIVAEGGNYVARNWSFGGFLLDGAPGLEAGRKVKGLLRVAGRSDSFGITAETLRRDPDAGTLACRFLDPSPALVTALDSALAQRMLGRRSGRAAIGTAVIAGVLLVTSPAGAGGAGALVPGSAPLPQFHLNFPNLLIAPPSVSSAAGDLQIELTAPDRSVVQFLFSPRSSFAIDTDPNTGTKSSYAGLSWNLFEDNGFFGNLSLAGSLIRPGIDELAPRSLGPTFALHSMFELGYQLGDGHSLTLSLDRATTPDFLNDRQEFNNFHLRYGLKF